ncbi:MAG: heme NO-binding domain-containing protein [Gemmobacter sp.]
MLGLVNRSIQCFLRDAYGAGTWADIATELDLGPDGFEAMLHYDDGMTEALLDRAARHLDRPREAILEDLGTHLVSHPGFEPLRRLLRFGGVGFVDFLHSLEELPGRGRLAVPDLDLPRLSLAEEGPGQYALHVDGAAGMDHVLIGVLRAMADDYGALVLLDHRETDGRSGIVSIRLADARFSEGREFALSPETD